MKKTRLSVRQQAYAQHRAEGKGPEQSALESGYVGAYLAGNRNEKSALVRQEVERLKALQPARPATVGMPDRDEACRDLWAMSKESRGMMSARVAALKLLSDLMGWTSPKGPTIGIAIQLGSVEERL
jgi:hypothetical protein